MTTRTTPLALLLIALLAAAAWAGDRDIDETRPLAADGAVVVSNTFGPITVTGWDRDEIRITGRLDSKAKGLKIEGDREGWEIEVEYDRHKDLRIRKGSVLEIRIPHGCDVDLTTLSGDVDVSGVRGVVLAGAVSGDVKISGPTAGIDASAVSGALFIDSETDEVLLNNVSGYVEVRGVKKNLDVSIVSGEASIEGGALENVLFNCVSGELDMVASPARGAHWEISCHSGEITLKLPGDVDAEFDIEVFSGDVDNDFGPEPRRTSKYSPGKELQFTAGDGGAHIEIDAFSGDIRLVKR